MYKRQSLGDLFHVLPAVHAIKKTYNLTVDWVTQPEYADLVRCFSDVATVYRFPRRTLIRDWSAYRKQVAEERYDAVLDMQGLFKSALAAQAAKAPIFGHVLNRDFAGCFYTYKVGIPDSARHAVERGLDMARHFGAFREGDPAEFPVRFPVPNLDIKPHAVGLVPRSRWPAKNWPIKEFTRAATCISQKVDACFYVFGGPEDREACHELASALPGKAESLAGHFSLLESGGLLSKMKTVITVDSGPMHMAAAAGVPVVALFGVTDPGRTGPYGEIHTTPMSVTFADGKKLARKFKHAPPEAWVLDPKRVALAALRTLCPDRNYSVESFDD